MVVMSFHRHKLLFIVVSILFFALFARQGHAESNISPEEAKKLSELVAEEFSFVKTSLHSLDKDASRGDYEFYDLWLKGLEKEKNRRPTDSIIFYKKALEIDRVELSTYEILFSLGRAYFLTGQNDKALSALREFTKDAEQDLSGSGPWALTSEGKQVMRRKIAYSKWIIDLCKRSDK